MLHQRGLAEKVVLAPGGYYSTSGCDGNIVHGALTRFPTLKVAVIENGSSWVEPLLKNMADIYKKMPTEFAEDPVEAFKRCVYISPFWEDNFTQYVDMVGAEHGVATPVNDTVVGIIRARERRMLAS